MVHEYLLKEYVLSSELGCIDFGSHAHPSLLAWLNTISIGHQITIVRKTYGAVISCRFEVKSSPLSLHIQTSTLLHPCLSNLTHSLGEYPITNS